MAKASEIKKSLEDQLKAKGADVMLYRALIDDYMWFYQQFHQMQADIKKYGRTYTAVSAAGKDYEKDNPAVKNALLYSKQMLVILNSLGLSTEHIVSGAPPGDDDGDL